MRLILCYSDCMCCLTLLITFISILFNETYPLLLEDTGTGQYEDGLDFNSL